MAVNDTKDIKYRIGQLRLDKLILAAESIAFFMASICFHLITYLLEYNIKNAVLGGYILSFLFFLRMIIKNIRRKEHIRRLERKIYNDEIKNIK